MHEVSKRASGASAGARRESSRLRAARRWHLDRPATPLEAAAAETSGAAPAPPRARWLERLLTTVALVAAAAATAYHLDAQRRAIRGLPPAERQQAYASALESFRSLCGRNRDDALRTYCREQAQAIASFPECDAYCESLVAPELRAKR